MLRKSVSNYRKQLRRSNLIDGDTIACVLDMMRAKFVLAYVVHAYNE
jgi:hypothetical protein